MTQESYLGDTEKPEMSLTRKLTALADGLNVYSSLQKDEEIILIPFSFSLYGTARTVKDFAQTYLDELNHNECREVLDIDFSKMTSVDYWLNKCEKLKRDMEALGTVPMKEHGFTVTLIDFTPAFTTDISKAIVDIIMEVIEMLRVIYQKIDNAPLSLYGNFYRYQKNRCDRHPVEERYKQFKRDAGVLTLESLMDKQASEIEGCLKKKLLRHTREPSDREVAQMNLEKMYKHLPYGYVIPEDLKKCYARFFRFVLKDGDILRVDDDLYGNYLFQYFYQLSEAERQALIELDIMLEMINEDMMALNTTILPDELATPEGRLLLEKARKAGYLDAHYQPKLSNTKSAMLADEIATRLKIRNRWKVFEQFWNRHDMYKDNYEGRNQKQSLSFLDEIRTVLD